MKPTPLKVQDVNRTHRFGIVVSSYQDLVTKGCRKLNIPRTIALRICLESDGTDVSDEAFLQQIPSNSVLVFLQPGDSWTGYWSYVLNAFEEAKKVHPLYQVKERIEETLHFETDNAKVATITTFLTSLEHKRDLDSRREDPDWFEGLQKNATSKEKCMKDGARGRIRSYYYSAKKGVTGSTTTSEYEKKFQSIFDNFAKQLRDKDYYGGYFGRSESEEIRFCDSDGWFNCEGPFDADSCPSTHLINPYDNKESRIVFSTWNLDHQIEKSRSVVPSLVNAVRNLPQKGIINLSYFFDLMFTKVNLRLVHIACHKKCEHSSKKVQDDMVYCTVLNKISGGKVQELIGEDAVALRRSRRKSRDSGDSL